MLSQWLKLLERIRNSPKTVTFEDLDKVLRRSGFERRQSRKGSSHFVYTRGTDSLTVPFRNPYVKEVYVKRATELIEGDDN